MESSSDAPEFFAQAQGPAMAGPTPCSPTEPLRGMSARIAPPAPSTRPRRMAVRAMVMSMAGSMALMAHANACDGPAEVRQARPAAVKAYVLATGKSVLTFGGYSGSGYEDPEAMLARAERELAAYRPAETLVNIGATAVGIGAVYDVAKRLGFTTMGIVSSLARDEKVELSRCVDLVFYVPDRSWGGRAPESGRLSPTSQAIVDVSGTYLAIGGGGVTRDELLAVRQAGRPAIFVPADTNHRIARERARKANRPEPTDFRGATHAAWLPGS